MMFAAIIIVILSFYFIDMAFTALYCRKMKKRDELYETKTVKRKIYTLEEIKKYRFPQKQKKWFFRLYKGWIRCKLHHLGKVPCHAYRNFILRRVYLMKLDKTAVLYGGFEIRSPWNIEIEGGVLSVMRVNWMAEME